VLRGRLWRRRRARLDCGVLAAVLLVRVLVVAAAIYARVGRRVRRRDPEALEGGGFVLLFVL
jgi:hypothetical protein